jgi:hypothetical protein
MSCQRAVYQWTEVVTSHMPHLSKPQAAVLALWSLGMVLARSCALTAVSLFLAQGLERKPNTVRQQLREFCYEAKAKRGGPRQEVKVETCFAPLLAWVLSWWEGQQLAFAVEATTLGQRFVVLVVSVLYRGCAIPVAWTGLPATEQHAWRGEWLRMLRQVRAVVPRHFFVIVLADRGLYARWLYARIVRLGWHPLLRINTGGTFRPAKSVHYQPLRELVPQPGTQWVGAGTAFQGPRRRLNCTLLARWDAGYADPWLILTDLAPSAGEACWYGLRAWMEICQSQPTKMPWVPLRLLTATIIYLRGLVKREDIVDVDLLTGDDDFFDQTLGNRLAIGKGETVELFPQQLTKVIDMVDHCLPVEGLLLRVRELVQFSIQVLEFRGQFLPSKL